MRMFVRHLSGTRKYYFLVATSLGCGLCQRIAKRHSGPRWFA